MPKFCSSGHQMEDPWEICPYCQRPGFQTPSAPSSSAKTRLDFETVTMSSKPADTPASRKTVLLNDRQPKRNLIGWLVAMDGPQQGEDFTCVMARTSSAPRPTPTLPCAMRDVHSSPASVRFGDSIVYVADWIPARRNVPDAGPTPVAREELKDNDLVRIGAVHIELKAL